MGYHHLFSVYSLSEFKTHMCHLFPFLLSLLVVTSCFETKSQPALYLKTGVGVAGDAGLEYIGPNLYAGVAVKTSRNVTLDFDLQYFPAKLRSDGSNAYYYGDWRQKSFSFGPTIYWGKYIHKGVYTGFGITYQQRTNYFQSSWTFIDDTLSYPTLNLRVGYNFFPSNRRSSFFIELNLTGPYSETYGNHFYLEILSQLSLNIGYRIGWRKENPADDKSHHKLQLTKPY